MLSQTTLPQTMLLQTTRPVCVAGLLLCHSLSATAQLADDLTGLASERPVSYQQKAPISANTQQNFAYDSMGRDPFAVTTNMLKLEGRATSDIEFTQVEDIRVPTMQLKGLIRKKNNTGQQQLAALLKVDGLGTFVVYEGDTIGLQAIGGSGVLMIEKIYSASLVVKAGRVGARFIVR